LGRIFVWQVGREEVVVVGFWVVVVEVVAVFHFQLVSIVVMLIFIVRVARFIFVGGVGMSSLP